MLSLFLRRNTLYQKVQKVLLLSFYWKDSVKKYIIGPKIIIVLFLRQGAELKTSHWEAVNIFFVLPMRIFKALIRLSSSPVIPFP